MIRAIIFDFDGTLVESLDIKTQAFVDLFINHGPNVVKQVVEHHLNNGGMPRSQKIAHYYSEFLQQPLDAESLQKLCQRFADMVVDLVVQAPLVRGTQSFLDENYERYALFIASGTPQDELRAIVRYRGLKKYFRKVVGSPNDKISLTRGILSDFGLEANQVLFVGDSMADYHAAQSTSTRFVGRIRTRMNPFPYKTIVIRDMSELDDAIIKTVAQDR